MKAESIKYAKQKWNQRIQERERGAYADKLWVLEFHQFLTTLVVTDTH